MKNSNWPEIKEALRNVFIFLVCGLLIALHGSTGHWTMVLSIPVLMGGFAHFASHGDMKWVLRSAALGLIAGLAWYLTY